MAPPLDDYMVRMKNLHQRYSLPASVMTLFRALGEQQRGYDPDGLGRLMRMSVGMRKACTDTIYQLAMVMQKNQDPDTVLECTELIRSCTEMLDLANQTPTERHFSLMTRLPIEIRRRVYGHYFEGLFPSGQKGSIMTSNKAVSCGCMPIDGQNNTSKTPLHKLELHLALTCKAIKDEVLTAWVQTQKFRFGCGCELKNHLLKNTILRENMRSLKIHWNGPQSDSAFKLLKQVTTLKCLIVEVSKSTSNNLSKREKSIRKFFHNTAGKQNQTRLSESLGFDELLNLENIGQVTVSHVTKSYAPLRPHEDRHNLEMCLMARITPKHTAI